MNGNLLRRTRGEPGYQAVIIDLALAGIIDKSKAENLLGYKIKDSWGTSQYSKKVSEEAAKEESEAEDTVVEETTEDVVVEESSEEVVEETAEDTVVEESSEESEAEEDKE